MPRLSLELAWRIDGPFLASGGEARAGIDRAFHRAAGLALAVPKTHVKGKIRESLRLVCESFAIDSSWIDWWLGSESRAMPRPERVFFSDLRPFEVRQTDVFPSRSDLDVGALDEAGDVVSQVGSIATSFRELKPIGRDFAQRTAIHPDTRVALAHTLRVEEIQPRGLSLWWVGRVQATTATEDEARKMGTLLALAARAVEQLGSEKSVGYGELREIRTAVRLDGKDFAPHLSSVDLGGMSAPPSVAAVQVPAKLADPGAVPVGTLAWHAFSLTPLEPVFLAGLKRPDSNFVEGLGYVTGSAIKGALAAVMNLETGRPVDEPITIGHPAEKRWPDLVGWFSRIQIRHAYPAPGGSDSDATRPFPVPLSAIATEKRRTAKRPNRIWDVALTGLPAGRVPKFAPDCEDLSGFVAALGKGGADLVTADVTMSVVVRTAIDAETLAASDQQLFGHSQIAELVATGSKEGAPARRQQLTTRIAIPEDDPAIARRIAAELEALLPSVRLGKTNALVAVRRTADATEPLEIRLERYGDRPVVLTLLSDTLLDLGDPAAITGTTRLESVYDAAWLRALAQSCLRSRLELGPPPAGIVVEVFAQQRLVGGWSGKRGADAYRAFLLTSAGSVFVTSWKASAVRADARLLAALRALEEGGVPAPSGETWATCPYVPENGFGEVSVCHPWHVARALVDEE